RQIPPFVTCGDKRGSVASPQAMTERAYAPSELSPSAGRAAVCSAGTSAAARGTPLYTSVCSNTSAHTGAERLPPAVVMDVDETVLDNSPYQARLVRDGASYEDTTWDLWVAEKKAKAVPGVVDFAKAAAARGVTILYISNRAEHLQAATIANLKAEGLPVKDESVFLGLGTFVADCEQNGSEKLCRRKLAGQKYRVLMQFGDQLGDFVEIVANTPKDRDGLYGEYEDWFGERWFMLPNPSYGSWEPALFNNAWGLPAGERRSLKHGALDYSK
ncbi:MAG: hypothetical protein RLZZ300_2572, partial [Pseudomonadota bacterium]